MVGGIFNVREQGFYPELLKQSKDFVGELQRKGWDLAEIYWRWGRKLAEVKTEYGDATIMSLADDVGRHNSTLYRARAIGVKYPALASLKEAWDKGKQGGKEMSWHRLTRDALPSPTDDPGAYGGKTRVVDNLMHEVETLVAKVEKLEEFQDAPELDENTKRQIAGVLSLVGDTLGEDLPPPNIDGGYMQYIKTQPCLQCDAVPVEPWVLTLFGLPDQTPFAAIPLCSQHYKEMKRSGQSVFKELHGLDYYKIVLKLCVPYLEATNEDNL